MLVKKINLYFHNPKKIIIIDYNMHRYNVKEQPPLFIILFTFITFFILLYFIFKFVMIYLNKWLNKWLNECKRLNRFENNVT